MKRIWIPLVIVIPMLLWALNPENPYGYYILLRWVCCAAFAYLAIQALAQEKDGWFWVVGVIAVIYNPIIRIHLTREIWTVINFITIAIAIISIFVLKKENLQDNRELNMNTDNTNGEIIIKETNSWVFSVSKAKQCMFIDTTDYHPKKLELSRKDVKELLNKMDKIIKS